MKHFSVPNATGIILLTICCTTQAAWIKSNGPKNPYTLVAASDYSGSGNPAAAVYAGTDSGFYRSLDTGATWIRKSVGLPTGAVKSILRVQTNLFVGVPGNGIFWSQDTGASWTARSNGLTNLNVQSLALWNSNLYAGTDQGVFKSTDQGATWSAVNTGLTNTMVQALVVRSTGLLVGTAGGIYQTTNGTDWTPHTGITSSKINALERIGAAATDSGMFRNLSGTSWTAVNNGLTNRKVAGMVQLPSFAMVAGTQGGIFVTSDFSQTNLNWTSIQSGLPDSNITAVGYCMPTGVTGSMLLAGTTSGIWRRLGTEILTTAVYSQKSEIGKFEIDQQGEISLRLKNQTRVTITVYSISGENQGILIDRTLPAGPHYLRFSTAISSGPHVYGIRIGDHLDYQSVTVSPNQ
jgi:ligand-binding sensor domain-containing protein